MMMKAKSLLLVLTLCFVASVTAQAATVIDEIKKIDDIATYHVPRFLIKNVMGMNDVFTQVIPGTDLTALRDIESLDIIMVHKNKAKKKTRKLLERLADDPAYEVIFQAKKRDKKDPIVYGLPLSAEDYKEIIVVVDEDDNITIINVKGLLNVDRLNEAVPIE